MITTRTARRFLAAASLTAVGFVGMADLAAAQPVGPGTVAVAPHTDPEPTPGPIVAIPTPDPQPEPPAPEPELPIAQPAGDDDPQPVPHPDLPIAQPTGHGDPDPTGDDLPIANPAGDPEVDPDVPVDPDLPLGTDPGCTVTHGTCPGDDDTPTPDGHCFDDAGEVIDPSECIPTDDTPADDGKEAAEPQVDSSSSDRGALPRTGSGIALLAAVGTALTAAGAAAKRVARR